MIVENQFLENIKQIWKENNNGYITKESNETLINNKDMIRIVYLENDCPAGYVAVYPKNDFCNLEEFPDKIEKEGNIAYIWEIVTDKKFTGKGIASKLMEYVLKKFKNYTIYSCISNKNIPSLNLHKKYKFKKAYEFKDETGNQQIMLVRTN